MSSPAAELPADAPVAPVAADAPASSAAAGGADGRGATSATTPAGPQVILVVGMAGSGKTTAIQRLKSELTMRGQRPYVINLDPAVTHIPYTPNIDIRDTVNYSEVMKQYDLGPNGAIVTALNLFATRFDQVIDLLEKKDPPPSHIIIDTPGQIEVFSWSASGGIITDLLASTFPTCLLYVADTVRSQSAVTFMSNMLYACSMMYKSRLPFMVAFNKVDVTPADTILEWISDFEAFQSALDAEAAKSDSYIHSLTRSMSLALDEFYSALRVVAFSAATGEGCDELLAGFDDCVAEYYSDYVADLAAATASKLSLTAAAVAADVAAPVTGGAGAASAPAAPTAALAVASAASASAAATAVGSSSAAPAATTASGDGAR